MHLYYIALHTSYTDVMIGLFHDKQLIDSVVLDHKKSSSLLIPSLDSLLQKHHFSLQQFPFIAIHQGPGPFTTVRVVVTSANGLAYASNVPLIGVDGLEALISEHQNPHATYTVALLNAFGEDLYVRIAHTTETLFTGVLSISNLLCKLSELTTKKQHHTDPLFWCLGNGVELYREQLEQTLGSAFATPHPLPHVASLYAIGVTAYQRYCIGDRGVLQIEPLYLKTASPAS